MGLRESEMRKRQFSSLGLGRDVRLWESPCHPVGQEQLLHSAAFQRCMLMCSPNPREAGGPLPVQAQHRGWILWLEKVDEETQLAYVIPQGRKSTYSSQPPGHRIRHLLQ